MNLQTTLYFLIILAVFEVVSDLVTKTPLWLFTQCYYAYLRMWKTTIHLRNIIHYDRRKKNTEIENQFSRWSPKLGNYVTLHAIKAISSDNKKPSPAIELIESNIKQHDPTVLLGEPGSGKTTVVEALVYKLAYSAYRIRIIFWFLTILISGILVIADPAYTLIWLMSFILLEPVFQRVVVPILVRARSDYTGGNVDQWFEFIVSQALGPKPIGKWKNIVFIIDGVNEIQENIYGVFIEGWRKKIIAHRKQSLLFTSRSGEDPSERLSVNNTLTILDLDDDGVHKFLQVYERQKAKEEKKADNIDQSKKDFLELSKKGLLGHKGIGRNPYWLRLMVENGLYTHNRGVLFHTFCTKLLRRELIEKPEERKRYPAWKTVDLDDEIFFLSQLALYMHKKGSIGLSGEEGWNESIAIIKPLLIPAQLKPLDVFLEAKSASLLRFQRSEQVEFVHQLIQEYFAAVALKDEINWSIALSNINDVSWWETLFLLGGLIDHKSRRLFTKFLEKLLQEGDSDYGIFVAIAMLQHIENPDLDLRKKVYEAFISSIDETLSDLQKKSVFELGRLIGDDAAEAFATLLTSSDVKVQKKGILLLKTLGGKRSVEILLRTIKIPHLHPDGHDALVETGIFHKELLKEKLSDSDWRVRWGVVELLGEIGNSSEDGIIEIALGDNNWYVQWGAINALGKMQYFEPLIEIAQSARSDLLPWIKNALLNLKGDSDLQPIVHMLGDEDPQRRNEAASLLTNIGFPNTTLLIDALSNDNWRVRCEIASILGEMKDVRSIPHLVNLLNDTDLRVRQKTKEAIRNFGTRALIHLNKILESDLIESDLKIRIIEVLGEIEESTEILIANLNSSEMTTRIAAINGLGKIKNKEAFNALTDLLKRGANLTPYIVDALSNFGTQSTTPLLELLLIPDPEICVPVLIALSKIKDERAISALARILHEVLPSEVRLLVVHTLGQIPDRNSAKVLVNFLGESNLKFTESVTDALGNIGIHAVDPLINSVVNTKYWLVRVNAIKALGKNKDQRAFDFIQMLSRNPTSFFREPCRQEDEPYVLQAIYNAVESQRNLNDIDRQEEAHPGANNLVAAQTDDTGWITPLIKALEDEDLFLKQRAAITLGDVAVDSLINALVGVSQSTEREITEIIIKIGEPAYSTLIEKLSEYDQAVCSLCTKILIQIGEPTIVPLFETLKYSTEDLQNQIIAILLQIGKPVSRFLIQQLDSPDNKSVILAQRILVALGPLSVENLVESLARKKTPLDTAIRAILNEIGDRAITPLIDILEKEENIPLIEELLFTIGANSIPRLVDAVRVRKTRTRKYLLDILVKLSPASIEPSIELLSYQETSQDGFYILKEIGTAALTSLLYALEDANPRIRHSVPKVISSIGKPAFDFLLEKLVVDDEYLNALSLYVIVKVRETTENYFINLLCSDSFSDQDRMFTVAKKLGTILLKPIINILTHSEGVRIELLMRILKEIGDLSVQELALCMPFNESETNVAVIETILGFGERAIKPLLNVFPRLNRSQQKIVLELLFQTGKCSPKLYLMLLLHSNSTQKKLILSYMLKIGQPMIPVLFEALYNKSLYDFALKALRAFSKDQLAFELYLKSLQSKYQRDRAIDLARKLNLADVELQLRTRIPKKQYIPMIITKLIITKGANLSSLMDDFERLPQKMVRLLQRLLLENQTRILQ